MNIWNSSAIALAALLAACGNADVATSNGSGQTCTGKAAQAIPATTATAATAPPAPPSRPAGTAAAACTPPAGACADYSCDKHVYWGDLHSHTTYSLDSFYIGNRNDPLDAYAFAKGEKELPIAVAAGGTATAKIDRPLDFLAVTDHSEFFSVTGECVLDGAPTNTVCTGYLDQGSAAQGKLAIASLAQLNRPDPHEPSACDGTGGPEACAAAAKTTWQKIQQAAATANDACHFTSLVGYEWTAQTDGENLHRNVIFASDKVPDTVFDYIHYPSPLALWKALEAACTTDQGCDVLTIPHNSNYSEGHMWDTVQDPAAIPYMTRYQTLVEVFQHKGGSECLPADALGDPQCAFEVATGNLAGGAIGGSSSDLDPKAGPGMVRNGLGTGLSQLAQSGTNPMEMGFVGATDTHDGTPGHVAEDTYTGHLAEHDDTPIERLRLYAGYNPGGITGVWAEQNTRDAIFAALKRRETFATSGPRIPVRFYAIDKALSASQAAAYCRDPGFPAKLVSDGAETMGARMTGAKAPVFFVSALRDDAALDSVDIVKLVADKAGQVTSSVHTIRLSADSCSAPCVYWSDPHFDATEPSLYYARVFQVPTWRWSHYDCATSAGPAVPDCEAGGKLDVKVQERAWTSAIFTRP